MDEADWKAAAALTELTGEVLLPICTAAVEWAMELRGTSGSAVRRVLDIGSGPGVGTCELARLFPEAHLTAVDSSPAMLERVAQRADERGCGGRVTTRLAELPDGLDGTGRADVVWASMSLHHVGDEVAALRALRSVMQPYAVLVIAEFGDPMRVLPDNLPVGSPGLAERVEQAGANWFASMRSGLPGAVESGDLTSMLAEAGFDVLGTRQSRVDLEAPLSADAHRFAVGMVQRLPHQFENYLEADDLAALKVLADNEDPRSVAHRTDLFMHASQQVVVARPKPRP